MTNTVVYKNSILEYIKKQDTQIISILGFNLTTFDDLYGLLRELELIAKRTKIKEVWCPIEPPDNIKIVLNGLGYKKCILGYNERMNKHLVGFKKIL